MYKKHKLGAIRLPLPGMHNIINALASIAVCLESGIGFSAIQKMLSHCEGVNRRFQKKFYKNNVLLVDDYAHHPTEIKAVIDTAKNFKPDRILAVFQPHRFSRTKLLIDDFARCFCGVDRLVITGIYSANEDNTLNVDIKELYEKLKAEGFHETDFVKKHDLGKFIMKLVQPGDFILVLGAGDISIIANELMEELGAKYA